MKELTTQEKATIFAMYLGQPVAWEGKVRGVLVGITNNMLFDLRVIEDIDNNTPIVKGWCSDDTKLILKPLSSITDEDAIQVALMCFGDMKLKSYWEKAIYWGKTIINFHILDHSFGEGEWDTANSRKYISEMPPLRLVVAYQYLISKGYAVPLYPYGKTAIELGLAIDSTTSITQ